MNNECGVGIPIPIHIYRDRGKEYADRYVSEALRESKRRMIEALFEKAWHGRYWVIRFDEYWPSEEEIWQAEHGFHYSASVTYRITLRIFEAQTESVVLPELVADIDAWHATPVTDSFIDLVKYRIRKWRQNAKS